MNTVLTSELPEKSDLNLNAAKMQFITREGLQEYLNSYECHLNMQRLSYDEIQEEMDRVRWATIYEMQKNYQYN